MSQFNFKSAICTNRQQSERLLSLGLKKETADMVLCEPFDYEKHKYSDGCVKIVLEEGDGFCKEDIPAWSLHRLLMMTTSKRKVMLIRCESDLFDVLIKKIEHEIKEGYFPKEYLV